MRRLVGVWLAVLTVCPAITFGVSSSSTMKANPIRRVVNMLSAMQVKVEEEGKKQLAAFDEFMCYCKKERSGLSFEIEEGTAKVPQLESSIKETAAEKAQLESDVVQHKKDRDEAKSSLDTATGLRNKEATEFASYQTETTSNIEAMLKAIAALEKGMAGAFLQTDAADTLRRVLSAADIGEVDREVLTSFLSSTEETEYAPQSGEILGILKQLHETMGNELTDAQSSEQKAIADFATLEGAKKKEIDVLTKGIGDKQTRIGDVGVELVNAQEDLETTSKKLAEDTKMLNDLEEACTTRQKEWEEISMTRSEELLAIADTIKILNDDDALELFKKTLPVTSFLQLVSVKSAAAYPLPAAKALAFVQKMATAVTTRRHMSKHALRGRRTRGNFEKVIKMVDDMVGVLGVEGGNDEKKKKYCRQEIDGADDKKKELELTISDLEKVIDSTKSTLKTTTEEIDALQAGIKDLDNAVSEQTSVRKNENMLYMEEMQSNNAAVELLELAKNRLEKFYNPKLATTTAAPEVSLQEEKISSAFTSFLQVSSNGTILSNDRVQYVKKTEESGGVLALIDLLKADLAKEIQEAEVAEKNAQASYEKELADAKEKRAGDMRAIAEKEGQKAEGEASLQKTEEEKDEKVAEAIANTKYLATLHKECDWLLQNFEIRREARASEVESLQKAKAVLSGADYS